MYNTNTHQNSRKFPTNFFSSFREKVGHFLFCCNTLPPPPLSSTTFVNIHKLCPRIHVIPPQEDVHLFAWITSSLENTHREPVRKQHHTSPHTPNFRIQQTFSTKVTNARSLGRVSSRPDHSPRRKPQNFPIGLHTLCGIPTLVVVRLLFQLYSRPLRGQLPLTLAPRVSAVVGLEVSEVVKHAGVVAHGLEVC